jgi:hypothetical protein
MKSKTIILFLALTFGFVASVSAQGFETDSISTVAGAYRFYKDVDNISINVPTVVELPFEGDLIERFDFVVLDKTGDFFEPHYFKRETLINEIPVSVSANPNAVNTGRMIDKDSATYTEFLLPEDAPGQAQITLSGASPITSSSLTLLLDSDVALPTSVEIRALVNGQNQIVVASRRVDRHTIRFPQTTSNE